LPGRRFRATLTAEVEIPLAAATTTIEVGERRIALTSQSKKMFPDDGITKGELVDYYLEVAPWMLPHVGGRPLTLQCYPAGIGGHKFYQKNLGEHFVQELAVPGGRLFGAAGEGPGAPHDREGARGAGVGLGPLRVLDGAGARALGVPQRDEAADVDDLTRGVEDVRGLVRREGDAELDPRGGTARPKVDDADRQAAVQGGDVAGVDGGVDRAELAVAHGFDKNSEAGLLRPVGLKIPPWRRRSRTAARTLSSLCSGAEKSSARAASSASGDGSSASGRGKVVVKARRSRSGWASTVSMAVTRRWRRGGRRAGRRGSRRR
jgi:hypothetical protein